MNDTSRLARPKTEQLPTDLLDLASALAEIPDPYRTKVEAVFSRVCEGTRRRRRILALVQDALGQLRLDMKYLMFDLEATRRERDTYREKLEEDC